MVYSSGPEKDQLKARQMFHYGCCLADCRGGRGWASVSAGENGCGVSICW